jgi:hypothetical protein
LTASDWATLADLATALGTLVLAIATFSAIRSANRSARIAERSMLIGLRPVLMPTRREDTTLKANFGDNKWVHLPGGGAAGEVGGGDGTMGPADGVIYLALPLRNAGSGIAVILGWIFYPEWRRTDEHPPVAEFRQQSRDLYVPAGDIAFWEGAIRDPQQSGYEQARKVIMAREPWTIDLLYGDHEGGQRVITRFTAFARTDPDTGTDPGGWIVSSARHWNIDRPDPRRDNHV